MFEGKEQSDGRYRAEERADQGDAKRKGSDRRQIRCAEDDGRERMTRRVRNAEVRSRSDELPSVQPMRIPRRRAHVDEERRNAGKQSLHEVRPQDPAMIGPTPATRSKSTSKTHERRTARDGRARDRDLGPQVAPRSSNHGSHIRLVTPRPIAVLAIPSRSPPSDIYERRRGSDSFCERVKSARVRVSDDDSTGVGRRLRRARLLYRRGPIEARSSKAHSGSTWSNGSYLKERCSPGSSAVPQPGVKPVIRGVHPMRAMAPSAKPARRSLRFPSKSVPSLGTPDAPLKLRLQADCAANRGCHGLFI